MIKEKLDIIKKRIVNNTKEDKYFKDILLFEINDIDELNIDKKNIKVFRTARHKNDMPSVFTLGKMDKSMKDCMVTISESGSSLDKIKSNYIISDSLTIIGNNNYCFVIAFKGGFKHLIKTIIKVDNRGNFISLKVYAELNLMIKPNESFDIEELELYYTKDVNDAINDFCESKNKKIRYIKPMSVYSTWYYYGQKIDFNDCITNLNKIKEYKLPFDVFQIDDGYEDYIGDYNPNSKFPNSLETISKTISEYGLTPGIWTSPFIVDIESKFYNSHKDWILYDLDNKPCIFNVNNKDYYIIDITIEDTWDYFKNFYMKLSSIGFKYHKLDFTRAPLTAKNPNYKNKYKTVIECYKEACQKIREGMGYDSFFLMCGGLYDTLIGIVDAARSGSDILSCWTKKITRGGKTLPYTMKQSLLRYYYSKWFYNDPDCLIIRRNKVMEKGGRLSLGLLNDDEVKTATLNQLLGSGIISSTEPLDKIELDRLNNLKHILPIRRTEIKINNLLDINRYPDRINLKEIDSNNYMVLINYHDYLSINPKVLIKDIFFDKNYKDTKYVVIDFYSRKIYKDLNVNSIIKLDRIKKHASTILKLVEQDKFDNNIDFNNHYLM